VSIALAEPLVRLLYQHGQFTAVDTRRVALTLATFSFGLVANGLSLLLTRAFFGLQEPRLPTQVAVVNLVLNLVLDLALLRFGAAGIAFATSIVTTFNAVVLAIALRRRVGLLHGRETLASAARTVVATLYCVGAAFGVWYPLDRLLGHSTPAQILSLGAGLAAGAFSYLAAARFLHLEEVEVIAGVVRRPSR
jgi:putative peptidoglycan lipid II flippase